ncbi:MAG: hypothetical protein EA383_11955 [Spirochaetaceae bacterium]|nr:MAG: hypothetical protein EA383_11955 [Spirochaetaceae bacterium]
MSRIFRTVLVLASVVILAGVPSLFAVRLYLDRSKQQNLAETHFSNVIAAATRIVADNDGSSGTGQTIAQGLQGLLRLNERLNSIVVLRLHGEVEYAWTRDPQRAALLNEPDASLGDYSFESNLWLERLTETIHAGPIQFVVNAEYQVLYPESVFQNIRDTLLTIIAFALLLIVGLIASLSAPAHAVPTPHKDTHTPDKRTQAEPDPVPEPVQDLKPEPSDRHSHSSQNNTHIPSATTPLVSEDSGMSFAEHLNRRLDLELQRAAENELDVTVIYGSVLDSHTQAAPEAAVFGRLVLEFFPFEDLVFDLSKEEPGLCCIILPGIDLSGALRKAQRFVTLSRRHDSGTFRTRLGASSRNGRLVESVRLLNEAREALGKTDDTSPIVGFLPDPDRYRRLVRNSGDRFSVSG